MFDKIDAFRVYDRTRYLVLFEGKYDFIYKIRYLILVKSDIVYIISHKYAKLKLIYSIFCL